MFYYIDWFINMFVYIADIHKCNYIILQKLYNRFCLYYLFIYEYNINIYYKQYCYQCVN